MLGKGCGKIFFAAGFGFRKGVGEQAVNLGGDARGFRRVFYLHHNPADGAAVKTFGFVVVVVMEQKCGAVGALVFYIVDAFDLEFPGVAAIFLREDRRDNRHPVTHLPAKTIRCRAPYYRTDTIFHPGIHLLRR